MRKVTRKENEVADALANRAVYERHNLVLKQPQLTHIQGDDAHHVTPPKRKSTDNAAQNDDPRRNEPNLVADTNDAKRSRHQ